MYCGKWVISLQFFPWVFWQELIIIWSWLFEKLWKLKYSIFKDMAMMECVPVSIFVIRGPHCEHLIVISLYFSEHIFSPLGPIWLILHLQSGFGERVYSDLNPTFWVRGLGHCRLMCKILVWIIFFSPWPNQCPNLTQRAFG